MVKKQARKPVDSNKDDVNAEYPLHLEGIGHNCVAKLIRTEEELERLHEYNRLMGKRG